MTFEERISNIVHESIAVKSAMLSEQMTMIIEITQVLIAAYRANGKVVLFGNGGSAADAQHVAGELVSRFLMDRDSLPAIALTVDTSIITSIGNDYAYDQIFARQVQGLVQQNDVVVGISTSGNSPNVLQGIAAGRAKGAITVGLTGQSGGQLKMISDLCLCIPSNSTPRIQETHITFWHIVCELVEREIFQQ